MPPLLNYDSPRALRQFLEMRGLGMRKRFGQNFLVNPDARRRLLDALDPRRGDPVWEIGSGLGAMTAELLERGALVTAFEIDRGFIAALREIFGDNCRFTLIPGDVLKVWREAGTPGDYLLGNLPYNIGAVLLADLIEGRRFFKRMVVTVQKEVARRITAKPGSKDYSSFSVLCGSAYRLSPLMVLKGGAFYPEPRVESQGVCFDLRTDIDPALYPPCFFPLVRSLFASRRKTVKNTFRDFIAARPGKDEKNGSAQNMAMELLGACGINPESRPETLSVEEFSVLAREYDHS